MITWKLTKKDNEEEDEIEKLINEFLAELESDTEELNKIGDDADLQKEQKNSGDAPTIQELMKKAGINLIQGRIKK